MLVFRVSLDMVFRVRIRIRMGLGLDRGFVRVMVRAGVRVEPDRGLLGWKP